MSDPKSNSQNNKLNDVENLLLLLADLNIIENEEKTESRDYLSDFPSLLDELPFLRDIPPLAERNTRDEPKTPAQSEKYSPINPSPLQRDRFKEPEISKPREVTDSQEAIATIQNLILGDFGAPTSLPLPIENPASGTSLEDDRAIHMLQDILVVPELEDLRNFKISVEKKLGIVEDQVNNPELLNKIEGLESLIQNASLNLSSLGSKLTSISDEQDNIPTEIAEVRKRIAELEHLINQPDELIQLLLPIIAELLSLKASQSATEMSQAITPIIAEVIFERSQLDHVAMSRAISDLLPNAISEQIRNSPEQIAKAIAPEVGAAIREQIRLDRDAVIDALAPEMGSAIKKQIALERDSMVDALYPVIGNTIAKYFAEAIRSINEKVEQTFSVEGMQRKLRAKMQGVSEAELILQESVPFEVQAIFLIHNLSGLVMIDIQRSHLDEQIEPIDSDMLAGMLTAIRSFASECMSRSQENTELDAINYSGSKIVLEVAGYCYLAVIIQGEPDQKLINRIRDLFGRIVQNYGDRFKEFDGDPSTVPAEAETALKTLVHTPKTSQKSLRPLLIVGFLALSVIAIPIGFYQYQFQRDRQLEAKVSEAFASTPELSVYRIDPTANGDSLTLSGKLPSHLRDLSLQVARAATALPPSKINNKIYVAKVLPEPTLVAAEVQRITKALNFTQGVNISSQIQNGQVVIRGQVDQPRLIPEITQTYAKISGVTTVTNLIAIAPPRLATRIYFPFAQTEIPASEISKLIEVQVFLDLYPDYSLQVYAKSDNLGDRAINYQLGIKRIQAVRTALLQRRVNTQRLQLSGIIEPPTQQSAEKVQRWVEFQPTLK
ncbi:MAG: flagellar motor protein MotB [Pseudanabaena sp.]|nr:MAG: flagellar motor protein MotB [Pseudanabaena sp.]